MSIAKLFFSKKYKIITYCQNGWNSKFIFRTYYCLMCILLPVLVKKAWSKCSDIWLPTNNICHGAALRWSIFRKIWWPIWMQSCLNPGICSFFLFLFFACVCWFCFGSFPFKIAFSCYAFHARSVYQYLLYISFGRPINWNFFLKLVLECLFPF